MTPAEQHALADRLDNTADWLDAVRHPDRGSDVRAAVAGLRQLAAITAAIGDPEWLGWWTGSLADIPETLKIRLARIADAASLSPTPTPQHCPTCGSDDPALGRSGGKAVRVHACPDAWHDSQG